MASDRKEKSTSSSRKKRQSKFKRLPYYTTLMLKNVLHSQQTDVNGDFTDTLLICDGGTIRVHAFILQAASPIIQEVIWSQGENYPYIREILIPDFSVKEMEKVVTLIYKGYVDLRNDKEAKSLRETLKFFKISNVEAGTGKFDKIEGSLKIQELNRIPQDIFKAETETKNEASPSVVVVEDSANKRQSSTSEMHQPRRSGRPSKSIVKLDKLGNGKEKSEDSDYNADSGDESSVEEVSEDEGSPKKRGRPLLNRLQPVVIQPRIESSALQNAVASTSRIDIIPPFWSTSTAVVGSNANNITNVYSSTDTEDEGWEEPDFKDKEWFARESRICQFCNATFEKPGEASICVAKHKWLRCYFCFKVYSSIDVLFKHFCKRHKHAEREGALICPFCDQAVPYKSVSCHVISYHLKAKPDDDHKQGGRNGTLTPKSCSGSPSVANTPSGSKTFRRCSRSRYQSTEMACSSSGNSRQKKRGNSSTMNESRKRLKSGDASSVEEASEDEGPPRKRGRRLLKRLQPVVKQPRIKSSALQNAVASTSRIGIIKPLRRTSTAVVGSNANNITNDYSSTDTEDEGWEEPDFKDKEWFARESRRCQSCNATFEKPAEASMCIIKHNWLRCYFCFKVYSSTDVLFKHFRKRHKQAGREGALICPFCDEAVPYRVVSCHVISVHLRAKPDDD